MPKFCLMIKIGVREMQIAYHSDELQVTNAWAQVKKNFSKKSCRISSESPAPSSDDLSSIKTIEDYVRLGHRSLGSFVSGGCNAFGCNAFGCNAPKPDCSAPDDCNALGCNALGCNALNTVLKAASSR